MAFESEYSPNGDVFSGIRHHRITLIVILVVILRTPVALEDSSTGTAMSSDPSDRLYIEHLLNCGPIRYLWGEHPLNDVVERVMISRVDHKLGRVLELDTLRSTKQVAGVMGR